MSEYELQKLSAEGRAALRAIEDDTFKRAFDTLHEQYLNAWRNTDVYDTEGREKLFLAVNILDKVRDHLTLVVSNGRLADHELSEIAAAEERKRARNRA